MKDARSSKWAFLFYKDSAPKNYLEVLNSIHVPYVISPWHDKDINIETDEVKKAHKHGCLYFDSLKSYSQVSKLISTSLNGPSHVEVVQSPKGMLDYFVHADNPEKTPYKVEDIEYGCGFNLTKFLQKQYEGKVISQILDIIDQRNIDEFRDLVDYVRSNNTQLLDVIMGRVFFFVKYLDSKRNSALDTSLDDKEKPSRI